MSTSSRIISVAGRPIRLYPAPEPGFAFSWASFADLLQAAEFPAESVPFWAERWRRLHPKLWADLDGEMMVPEAAGIGLFDATRQAGWPEADRAAREFLNGSRAFFTSLHHDLDLVAFRAAVNEATLRSALYGEAH